MKTENPKTPSGVTSSIPFPRRDEQFSWWRTLPFNPFRLFFPFGIVFGVIGVGHWVLWSVGWKIPNIALAHASLQTQGFLSAFVVGFLMTAFPRFSGTWPAKKLEIAVTLIAATSFLVATLEHHWLAAQLFYLLIFLAVWFFSGDNSPLWPRYLAMGAVAVTAVAFLVWMAPKLGWMALAVVPYAIAISAMAAAAMWVPWPGWPAMLGAASFLVSDFVLAAELFRLPPDSPLRRVTAPVVWWTYVAAQLLIVAGVVSLILAR